MAAWCASGIQGGWTTPSPSRFCAHARQSLHAAGFPSFGAMQRATRFDLWGLASNALLSNAEMQALVRAHLPVSA